MCLNTYQKRALTARKDITVYKELVEVNGPTETIVLPGGVRFKGHTEKLLSVNRKTTYVLGAEAPVVDIDYRKPCPGRRYARVERAYHAFVLSERTAKTRNLYKCTIPKGAKYYIGTNNGASKGIAANRIIIEKHV